MPYLSRFSAFLHMVHGEGLWTPSTAEDRQGPSPSSLAGAGIGVDWFRPLSGLHAG